MIVVRISEQMLYHRRKTGVWYAYPVSTAAKGAGNRSGSYRTPLGRHRIASKIGEGLPPLTAFRAREPFCIYAASKNRLPSLPWMAGKRTSVCEPCETRTFRMAYKQKSWRTFADQSSDWILTRILWLDGCETGKNRRGKVDSHARYIYIHGTHEEHKIGTPASHGCIRMCNDDLLELFEHVTVGESINIIR